MPAGVDIEIFKDESVSIRRAIPQVALSGLLGGLLASLLIYLFLGRWANTLVIVSSIPATIIVTFTAMRIFRFLLSTVSIGDISLAVGLVVDATVVVLENIFRNLKGEIRPRYSGKRSYGRRPRRAWRSALPPRAGSWNIALSPRPCFWQCCSLVWACWG